MIEIRTQEVGKKAKALIHATGGKVEYKNGYDTVRHGKLCNIDIDVEGTMNSDGTRLTLPCGCVIGITRGDAYYPGSVGAKRYCPVHEGSYIGSAFKDE